MPYALEPLHFGSQSGLASRVRVTTANMGIAPVVLGGLALAGILFSAPTPPQGQGTSSAGPVPSSCITTIVCGHSSPSPADPGASYIDWVVTEHTDKVCKCGPEINGQRPCIVDEGSECTFTLKWSFDIPHGKSINFGTVCYEAGELGPPDADRCISVTQCNAGATLVFELYHSAQCQGTKTDYTVNMELCTTINACDGKDC